MIVMNIAGKPHKIFRMREFGLHPTAERHDRKSSLFSICVENELRGDG
jgi:hypothetical protein